MTPALIALLVVALFVIIVLTKAVTIVPQAQAKVIERLGRYSRTLSPGLSILVPFVDRVRATIDLREQVISFPPQPVITSDNLQVGIDTVLYFQVTDPRLAVYGIANYITGWGGNEMTCSRRSMVARTRSTNGTRMDRPGDRVRL